MSTLDIISGLRVLREQLAQATPTPVNALEVLQAAAAELMLAAARQPPATPRVRDGKPGLAFNVPPFAENGIGELISQGCAGYREDYVYCPDPDGPGADHEPTEFEAAMLEDFVAGLLGDERVFGPVRAALAEIAHLQSDLAGIRGHMAAAAAQFRFYAEQHAAKVASFEKSKSKDYPAAQARWDLPIAEATEKAAVNTRWAERLEEAMGAVEKDRQS
ncbi:hypothetical protein [Phenylobacterium sp.]|uniref:hypothetical protein n=1 Tax=Phenylobacterium sp. TaxID=1871053 RepID=UPI0040354643